MWLIFRDSGFGFEVTAFLHRRLDFVRFGIPVRRGIIGAVTGTCLVDQATQHIFSIFCHGRTEVRFTKCLK